MSFQVAGLSIEFAAVVADMCLLPSMNQFINVLSRCPSRMRFDHMDYRQVNIEVEKMVRESKMVI